MAPKNRDPRNSDLTGTNIKHHRRGSMDYYYYVMPDGSKEPLLPGDRQGSIEAAHALNMALRPSGKVVDRIVTRVSEAPKSKDPHLVEVLDRVGVYNRLPIIERPGFHSIRALGIWLYTKAGYSDEYIMALAGHATEAMKARYTAGHEKREPLKVAAGLDLSAVDLRSVNWQTDLSKTLRSIVDEE